MRPLAVLTIDPDVLALDRARRMAWLDYCLTMLWVEVNKGEHGDSLQYTIMPPDPGWQHKEGP